MAKASEFFNTQDGNEQSRKEVCYNCKHIFRPFDDKPHQAELNESVPCVKRGILIKATKSDSCCYFEFYIK
ncbi:MAG: hypothetical protein LBU85_00540 [Treponema sp.]|jgi:hypothetical protein|nr:hypothetical protein [Treponema sp.]